MTDGQMGEMHHANHRKTFCLLTHAMVRIELNKTTLTDSLDDRANGLQTDIPA